MNEYYVLEMISEYHRNVDTRPWPIVMAFHQPINAAIHKRVLSLYKFKGEK